MTKLLVKFDGNWADEMDVKGFEIVTKKWWEKYQEKFPDKHFSVYIGSNQDMEFDNKKDYFSNFTAQEISEEEEKTLLRLFGNGSYGEIPWYENFDMDDDE